MGDEAVWLDEDWLHGIPWNASLSRAVIVAQMALAGWDHEKARATSRQLFEVFERWKAEKGRMRKAGNPPATGVEGPTAGRDAVPPWQCAGWDVVDPVDLLQHRLIRDEYQPFLDLSTDWKTPEETALALLCLHFAAERVDWVSTPGLLTTAGSLTTPPPYTNTTPSFVALKAGFELMLRWYVRVSEERPATRIELEAFAKVFIKMIARDIRAGHEYRERQKSSGLRGAEVRWAGDERTITSVIISRLAQRKDELDDPEPPRDLWPHLFSALEEAGFRPDEASDDTITYGDNETLTFDAFRRRIQRARNT